MNIAKPYFSDFFYTDGFNMDIREWIRNCEGRYPTSALVVCIPFETQGEAFLVDMGILWKSK